MEPALEPPFGGFERSLAHVRAERDDLDVRPSRWETRLPLPAVEALLADPLQLPERTAEWGRSLSAASGLAGFGALAGSLLGLPTEQPRPAALAAPAETLAGVAVPVAAAVLDLAHALSRARPFLELGVQAYSPAERERLIASFQRQLIYGAAERPEPELFDLAARFDLAALLQAWRGVAEAVDRSVASLSVAQVSEALPRSFVIAGSTVTLGGTGDDEYAAEDLKASSIILDLGGRNLYHGSPAAAGPREIKVVIDLGQEAVIDSSGPVASGVFGIGVLVLPNPGGAKDIRGGHFSMGAGLFGVGAFVARGPRSKLLSGDFSQGAASFGVGLLDVDGDETRMLASAHGQGFGFTQGAGLLRVRGARVQLECGLQYPDPREAQATLSLCQGTGYGPRAFAAGGFGLARVESDGAEIESGYFAQGSGYWHGFGGFWFAGSRARIQSRRYAKGAGVHTALGAMEVVGDENRILNWGVGPAYGWDWGVGYANVQGDRNELFTEWGSGHGDVNGHALLRLEGRANRLQLPELGTGILKRTAPSYGLALLAGQDTRLRAPQLSSPTALGPAFQASPWGVVAVEGDATLDPALAIPAPQWRSLEPERQRAAAEARQRNASRLAEADQLAAPERLARWLSLAAGGGLDGRTPFESIARLLSLQDEEAALLPGLVSTDRFDEFVILRLVVPAYGRRVVAALKREIEQASGLREQLLLGFFRSLPVADGSGLAILALRDPDARVRREGAGVLGTLFDRQQGEELGRLAFIEEALTLCGRAEPRSPIDDAALQRIGGKKLLQDLLAVLALVPEFTAADRVDLASRAPDPLGFVGKEAMAEFAGLLGAKEDACRKALGRELSEASRLESAAREKLVGLILDGAPETLPAALAGLGHMGRAEDSRRVAAGLEAPTAAVREAAAAGLARMGRAGEAGVRWALASSSAPVRALGALAAAQSSDPVVFALVGRGLADPEETVRQAAVAALHAAQGPLHLERKLLRERLTRLAANDPSASVRASAAFAAGSF